MSNIIYSKDSLKTLKSYDSKTSDRLVTAIESIPLGDIKKLKGSNVPPLFRLRVGKYRVVYIVEDNDIIKVIKIDTRGDVYK